MADKIHLFSTTEKSTHEICGDIHERIRDVIYNYNGAVPIAAAIGVLEIMKIELVEKIRIEPSDDAS